MAKSSPPPLIDQATVERLCHLSCLELSETEAAQMPGELQRIVSHLQSLAEVDVSGVEPLTSVLSSATTPLRDDHIRPSLPRELALREAPRSAEGGFLVPRFVDEG